MDSRAINKGSGKIHLKNVQCGGEETDFKSCKGDDAQKAIESESSDCTHLDDVNIACECGSS